MFSSSSNRLWSCWAVSCAGGGGPPVSGLLGGSSPRVGVVIANAVRAKARDRRPHRKVAWNIVALGWSQEACHVVGAVSLKGGAGRVPPLRSDGLATAPVAK